MFISFEGIEGSGKGTVLRAVCGRLAEQGVDFLSTREPGGSDLGAPLRALLLDARQSIVPRAELFLYLADRAQHVAQVIRPALAAGRPVLSDRYADSTIVYQGYGRGLNVPELFRLNESAVDGLWPELTFLLDIEPEIGLERARRRNAELGLSVTEGRFEAEAMSFHRTIRRGYLDWAAEHHERFRVIDGSRPPEDVFREVWDILSPRFS